LLDEGTGKPQGRLRPTEGGGKVRNFTDQLEGATPEGPKARRRLRPRFFAHEFFQQPRFSVSIQQKDSSL
jgi:hypothetical protein